jgi:hypothetical protein
MDPQHWREYLGVKKLSFLPVVINVYSMFILFFGISSLYIGRLADMEKLQKCDAGSLSDSPILGFKSRLIRQGLFSTENHVDFVFKEKILRLIPSLRGKFYSLFIPSLRRKCYSFF